MSGFVGDTLDGSRLVGVAGGMALRNAHAKMGATTLRIVPD